MFDMNKTVEMLLAIKEKMKMYRSDTKSSEQVKPEPYWDDAWMSASTANLNEDKKMDKRRIVKLGSIEKPDLITVVIPGNGFLVQFIVNAGPEETIFADNRSAVIKLNEPITLLSPIWYKDLARGILMFVFAKTKTRYIGMKWDKDSRVYSADTLDISDIETWLDVGGATFLPVSVEDLTNEYFSSPSL